MNEPASDPGLAGRPPIPDIAPDDSIIETKFGFAGEEDWIERARKSERPAPPPGRLGPYTLLEEIGRGGQGVVYKALQPGTHRVIAIKCFPFGSALGRGKRDRFEREIQALVRLSHPGIVAVYGAEVIDQSSVLLMEYVEGGPIDRWADGSPDAGRRARPQTLAVFALVCDAVSHAHQRGVIHRDLKPSNVLVDASGSPRVLDFGIARLVDDLQSRDGPAWTVTAFAGTPAYASPEQLGSTSDADTRSDIYSLGALLYRVLTGSEPFARTLSLPALIDSVRAGTVRRPSEVSPSIPRELDWIVRKAMNADPARRYQTADAVAADVRRFLRGEPVEAHPPGALYITAKFVRRHAVACGVALACAMLILSLVAVSVAQTIRVTRQNRDLMLAFDRESAERARADAQVISQRRTIDAINNILVSLGGWATHLPSLNRKDILEIIQIEIASLPEPGFPAGRAQMCSIRANLAGSTGRHEEALDLWTQAIGAALEAYAPGDGAIAALRRDRGLALFRLGRQSEAVQQVREAANKTTDRMERHSALILIVELQTMAREFADARTTAEQILAEAGADHPYRSQALQRLSILEQQQGRIAEARRLMQEALAPLEAAGRGGSLDAASMRVTVATLLVREGRAEEAEPLAASAVAVRLRKSGPLHVRTEEALLTHADILSRLGRYADAVTRLEQAFPRQEAIHGLVSKHVARHRFRLAAAHFGNGDAAQGRRHLALALSLNATSDANDPKVVSDAKVCESVLSASGWQVGPGLAEPLGSLAWLADQTHGDPSPEPPEAGRSP